MEGDVIAPVEFSGDIVNSDDGAHLENGSKFQQSSSVSDANGPASTKDSAVFIPSNESLTILQCESCDYQTTKKRLLDLHSIEQHIDHDDKVFECPDCDYITKYKYNLKTHLKRHWVIEDLDEGELFSCEKCNYKTQHKHNLKAHLQKHEKLKPFRCELCDFSTIYSHSLKHHVDTTHVKLRPFKCSKCSFTSARSRDLRIHESRHSAETPFICNLCSFKTAHEHALQIHMKGHELGDEPGPFSCDICPYQGATKALLRKHMKRHAAPKCHTCHLCSFSTSVKFNLNRHLERHQKEKPTPQKSFRCDTCGYETTYKHSLKRHMATHATIKPFKCGHCDYSAINMSQMRVHIAKHTGIKPFTCPECDYKTANKQHLLAHAAKHSNILLCCTHCDFHTKWRGPMKIHLQSHNLSEFSVDDDGSYTLNWRDVYIGSSSPQAENGNSVVATAEAEKGIQELPEVAADRLLTEEEIAARVIEDENVDVSLPLMEEFIKNVDGEDITLVTLQKPSGSTDNVLIHLNEESSQPDLDGNQEELHDGQNFRVQEAISDGIMTS